MASSLLRSHSEPQLVVLDDAADAAGGGAEPDEDSVGLGAGPVLESSGAFGDHPVTASGNDDERTEVGVQRWFERRIDGRAASAVGARDHLEIAFIQRERDELAEAQGPACPKGERLAPYVGSAPLDPVSTS